MAIERLTITGAILAMALLILWAFANIAKTLIPIYEASMSDIDNSVYEELPLVEAEPYAETMTQSEPEVQVETMPLVEAEQAVEVLPIVTQEVLEIATANTVTPGTKFGNIELPAVDITRSHAEDHVEYPQVRRCYENPNNIMMYRESHQASYKWMYHILCQSKEDGKWYDRLIYKIKDTWYEETGFIAKDGTWENAQRWLSGKGVERIKKLP